ncbi:5-formyltetrahydrofolate cyclo-ligase [Frankia canadensis]|uniref:5-formyltetrahydrofolate cyclo-ligase n=1 Tax=Frankia canadensis TaxID=1836972 RepID=A0A2I2KW97_9ACTN|nr:5-formyltetrahydrofolate cyclo-ligase [Frankia canadensis]SNQ49926.1 5-formyltetrahydrofolate cyclo-ligase [Frankia canadensis]SOU57216.1 5-formyltetrahydrofolate cyclo-ligase [Frankia canadensis]
MQGRQEPPDELPPELRARARPPLGTDKARLRARLLAQRRACQAVANPTWPRSAPGSLATRILSIPEITDARCVAAYVGLPGEPDLGDLLARLLARGTRVLLPVLRADLDLDFREHVGTLVPGALGTREPPPAAAPGDIGEAQALIIPALAVDRAGRRLGRGGGSYDRALVRAATGAAVIAVVYDQELLERVPAEPHDRSVTIVVTPSRTLRCEPSDGTREHPGPPTS